MSDFYIRNAQGTKSISEFSEGLPLYINQSASRYYFTPLNINLNKGFKSTVYKETGEFFPSGTSKGIYVSTEGSENTGKVNSSLSSKAVLNTRSYNTWCPSLRQDFLNHSDDTNATAMKLKLNKELQYKPRDLVYNPDAYAELLDIEWCEENNIVYFILTFKKLREIDSDFIYDILPEVTLDDVVGYSGSEYFESPRYFYREINIDNITYRLGSVRYFDTYDGTYSPHNLIESRDSFDYRCVLGLNLLKWDRDTTTGVWSYTKIDFDTIKEGIISTLWRLNYKIIGVSSYAWNATPALYDCTSNTDPIVQLDWGIRTKGTNPVYKFLGWTSNLIDTAGKVWSYPDSTNEPFALPASKQFKLKKYATGKIELVNSTSGAIIKSLCTDAEDFKFLTIAICGGGGGGGTGKSGTGFTGGWGGGSAACATILIHFKSQEEYIFDIQVGAGGSKTKGENSYIKYNDSTIIEVEGGLLGNDGKYTEPSTFSKSYIGYDRNNLINGYTEDIAQYPLENSLSLRTTDGISSVNNLPWQIVGTPNLSVFLVNAKNGTITDTQVRSRPIYGDQRLRINSSILNLNCYDYTYTNLYVVDSTDQIMNNRFNYTQFPVRYNGDATSDNADGRCGEASLFGNGRACVGGSPSFDTEQQEEIEYQYGLVDIITGDALTTTEYRQNANFGGGGGGGWGGLFEAVDGSAGGGGAISFWY